MEKFDLLVKETIGAVEIPMPANAWEDFEAKRGGESANNKIRSTFFLWQFAAAGAALAISLGTINFSTSNLSSPHSAIQHHATETPLSTGAAHQSGAHHTDSQSTLNQAEEKHNTFVFEGESKDSENQGAMESLIAEAENSSLFGRQLSNTDKMSIDYTNDRQTYTPIAHQEMSESQMSDSNPTIDETLAFEATNVSDKEKEFMRRLNNKLHKASGSEFSSLEDSNHLATKSTTVYKGASFKLGAPDAFTPNGDGVKDFFIPKSLKQSDNFVMKVYDDNGRVIFKSKNVDRPWEGKTSAGVDVPEGKYNWDVALIKDSKTSIFKGQVKLLRK